jgi:Cft2 family RNA processing exonuclease
MARKAAVKQAANSAKKKGMSDAHKAALAVGREEGRAVRRYLEALDARRPRPGRKRTVASVTRQLDETLGSLNKATPLDRVHLLQRRIDLEAELRQLDADGNGDDAELESAFVDALPGYSNRKHITYVAWREVGVPARVLRAAGIRRGVS